MPQLQACIGTEIVIWTKTEKSGTPSLSHPHGLQKSKYFGRFMLFIQVDQQKAGLGVE